MKTRLDVLCGERQLGWVLEDDHVGDGIVMSACAFTQPDNEIVAVVGPVKGGHAERARLLAELHRKVTELPG